MPVLVYIPLPRGLRSVLFRDTIPAHADLQKACGRGELWFVGDATVIQAQPMTGTRDISKSSPCEITRSQTLRYPFIARVPTYLRL